MNNLVAKHMKQFCRSKVIERVRTKYTRKTKHKGAER